MIDWDLLTTIVVSLLVGMTLGVWIVFRALHYWIKRGTIDLFVNGVRQSPDHF